MLFFSHVFPGAGRMLPALVLLIALAAGSGAGAESAEERLDRLDSLIGAMAREVSALRGRVEQDSAVTPLSETVAEKPVPDTAEEEIFAQAMVPEEKKRARRLSKIDYRRTGLGYTPASYFGSGHLGVTAVQWFDKWGAKGTFSAMATNQNRELLFYLFGARSLTRFEPGGMEVLHLYVMVGTGMLFHRTKYLPTYSPGSGLPFEETGIDRSKRWYEKPEATAGALGTIAVDWHIIDGLKITPEIGYRSSYRIHGHMDHKDEVADPDISDEEQSRLLLGIYFGGSVFFYFR